MPNVVMISDDKKTLLKPVTLDQLGKKEKFLEDVIADDFDLLNLSSRKSAIHGPYRIFRQLHIDSPQGKTIRPDIVCLTASGHVVIVEVKLFSNPELRDRRVISQIVDYASSFTGLDGEEIAEVFFGKREPWAACIEELFSGEEDIGELSSLLLERMQGGEIDLVIACDRLPVGLREMVEGISRQSAFSFKLLLVELVPYVGDNGKDIVFFPVNRLETEIVSRTAVSIIYEQGSPRPEVRITVDGTDKVEEAIEEIKYGIKRQKTPVNAMLPFLREKIRDLVQDKVLPLPWVWRNFDIGFHLRNDLLGTFKLEFLFERYNVLLDDAERVPERLRVMISIEGERDKEKRIKALAELANDGNLLKPVLGEGKAISRVTAAWDQEISKLAGEDIDPDEAAGLVENYLRQMSGILKFRAWK